MTSLDKSGQVWTSLDKSGQVWTSLDKSGQVWTSLDKFGQVWTSLDKSGQVWTSLDKSGQVWTSDAKHRRDSKVGHGNFKTSSNAYLGQDPQEFSRGSLKPVKVLIVLTILGTFKTCQDSKSLGLDQV